MMHLEFSRKDSNLLYTDDSSYNVHVAVAAKNCNTVFYGAAPEKIRRGENWTVHFQSGVSPERIYFLNQVHGDGIFTAEGPADPSQLNAAEADAIITTQKGSALVIRTADCYAVMLALPNGIAAVHSGWRSTEKNIAGKCAAELAEKCGADPSLIKAWIMPGIGADSYEVRDDVAVFFPDYISDRNGKKYLDLKHAIVDQLHASGLIKQNIFASYYDTFIFNDQFFSHRRGDDGRNLNYIVQR